MFNKLPDKKLIEGIKRGDEKIINYLYTTYFGTIKAHILKNSGSEDDAYDIFQDALMVLFKKIQANHIELNSDLKGYVFGVARNLWNNKLRKKRREQAIDGDYADDYDAEKLLDTPIEQIVQRSFLILKPECQKVLTFHTQGMDYQEIADKMGFKSDTYARRKKYLCKEELLSIIKNDPDYVD